MPMKTQLKAICVNASVELERGNSAAQTKTRFKGVAFSGNIVPDRLFDGSALAIDMASFKLTEKPKKIFMLDAHNKNMRVGIAFVRKVNDQILLDDGEFFSTPDALKVQTEMEEGGPFEFSIGLVGRTQYYQPGTRKKKKFDGQVHEIGAEMFDVAITETSFVINGADRKTVVQQFSRNTGVELFNFDEGAKQMKTVEELQAELDVAMAALAKAQDDIKLSATGPSKEDFAALQKQLDDQQVMFNTQRAAERLSSITTNFGADTPKEIIKVLSEMSTEQFAFAAAQNKALVEAKKQPATAVNFAALLEAGKDPKDKAVSPMVASAQRLGLVAKSA
jgi:hypothetical protein